MILSILHTIRSVDLAHGGPSNSVPALVHAISALGIDTRLLTWEHAGRRGYRGALAKGATLVHDHGMWLTCNRYAASMASRSDRALVISPRGMLQPWAFGFKSHKKRLAWAMYERRRLRSARLLHATSASELESIRRVGMRQPVAVLPNGVEVPDIVARSGYREGARRALFMSRIHPVKGLVDLIDAWSAVRPSGWELVIAGPGDEAYRREVEVRSRQNGLADTVHFRGPVDSGEKWELMVSSDLFLLPTHSENFGLVVAEALAAGLPVITTKAAPWQVIRDEQCGWWIDPGARTLAEALRHATRISDAERYALGRRGRAYVENNLAWSRIAAGMADVYQWVTGGGTTPDFISLN